MTAPRNAAPPAAARGKATTPGQSSPWRPPTRRAFVAALGAAAAALAARGRGLDPITARSAADNARDDAGDRPRRLTTRWVGHC
jgi:hypothetical protein